MDNQGRLLLRFDGDSDGTGKLFVQANSNGFSGEGDSWLATSQLQDFADAIAVFPIPSGETPTLASGFYKKDGSGELEQEHLALKVYPVDSRGHLGLQVRIATELWNDARPESQNTVKLEIIISYEPLKQFSRNLKALAEGRVEEAVIEGDILP